MDKQEAERIRGIRVRSHKGVIDNINWKQHMVDQARAEEHQLHELIDILPAALLHYVSGSLSTSWMSVKVPWDWKVVRKLQKMLERRGLELLSETPDSDSKEMNLRYRWKDCYLTLFVSAEHPEAKCVLVPIRKEMQEVITAYDHICPDSHPELFESDENGKLIYVGDDLFPAIKTEEE